MMKRPLGKILGRKRGQRGQALVELAMVLPVLMLLFVAIIDVADALQAYISVQSASRDGARLGSRNIGDNEVKDLVLRDLARMRNPGVGASASASHGMVAGKDAITVRACKAHSLIVTYPLLPMPNPINICTNTTMVVLKNLG